MRCPRDVRSNYVPETERTASKSKPFKFFCHHVLRAPCAESETSLSPRSCVPPSFSVPVNVWFAFFTCLPHLCSKYYKASLQNVITSQSVSCCLFQYKQSVFQNFVLACPYHARCFLERACTWLPGKSTLLRTRETVIWCYSTSASRRSP